MLPPSFSVRFRVQWLGFAWLAGWVGLAQAEPAGTIAVGGAEIPFVHPTVREPIPDGVSLSIPPALAGQSGAALGLVTVTEAPFHADPTGQADCTEALQRAIDQARDFQMVCFFPPGTYRVSGTLSCIQNRYQRSNGKVLGGHQFPCLLMGSRAGAQRPRIRLAPHTPGFGDPDNPKILLHFWARGYQNPTKPDLGDALGPEVEQPNISMNQMLVNLDLEIGEGNAGAIALRHQAAEGSAVEECAIDVRHGLTGIQGGIGSGGSCAEVTVIGGRIGLDYTGYLGGTQPTPVITGFTLLDQTGPAIRSTSRQTLVAVGLRIRAGAHRGPLIECRPEASQPNSGQLALVDGVVECAARSQGNTVIESSRSVFLENVFLRHAEVAVQGPGEDGPLPARPEGWLQVRRYARPGPPSQARGYSCRYPVYQNGQVLPGALVQLGGEAAPPDDLQSRHLWSPDFPGWETPGAVNVKAPPYAARGDGRTDDTAALQRAIDEHEVVFLPKGYYRLTRTLELRPRTKLIGVGQHLSVLLASAAEGDFSTASRPAPLVRTADAPGADTVLAFCGLYVASNVPGVYALHWRSGGRSVLRSVEFTQRSSTGFLPRKKGSPEFLPSPQPLAVVTGHGGGLWYNFRASSSPQSPAYRHLLVRDNREPFCCYQLSPQHVVSDYAVELCGAKRVSIFGTKYEGNQPMMLVRRCEEIRLIGHGGNGKGLPGGELFRVEDTPRFEAACLVDGPTRTGSGQVNRMSGFSTDPRQWHMLAESISGAGECKTGPGDRPVLYLREEP